MDHPSVVHTMMTGYPEREPELIQICDAWNCSEPIVKNQECVEHAGYLYCDSDCLLAQMYKEGNAGRVVAGE